MPKGKPRENQRRDVWLSDEDMQRIEMFADMMKQAGIDPNNQFGKVSVSKVIQWVLNGQPMNKSGKGQGMIDNDPVTDYTLWRIDILRDIHDSLARVLAVQKQGIIDTEATIAAMAAELARREREQEQHPE